MATFEAPIENVGLIRGDTFKHRIIVKNRSDGTVKNITGAAVKYTIRVGSSEGTVFLQKTVGAGVQLTTPLEGILDVTLTPVETALFVPKGKYVYDCEVTIGIEVGTVQLGKIAVTADVTHT